MICTRNGARRPSTVIGLSSTQARRLPASRLLRPRRDLDPRLRTRLNAWVVAPGAWTVVPVRLRRSWRRLDVHRRLLNNNGWRRVDVVRRVIPPVRVIPPIGIWRAPPERGPDSDKDATPEPRGGVPEPGVPVAPMAPCVARHCRNEKQCNR